MYLILYVWVGSAIDRLGTYEFAQSDSDDD